MESTEMNKRVIEAFGGEFTPKFLATVSDDGTPNCVPIISLEAWDSGTLICGNLMMWKTRKNMEANPRVTASVFTTDMNSWIVRGEFQGFERTGERFDKLNSKDMFRYNAYTGLRNVGVIKVKDVRRVRGMMAPGRILELAFSSIGSGSIPHEHSGPMPPQVTEKFSRLKAAKYLSVLDDEGYPLAVPVMSLFPTGHNELEFGAGMLEWALGSLPEPPVRAAASIITFDPVAYQVKGTISGYRNRMGVKTGILSVEEVYSASPPLPGKRLDVKEIVS